MVDLIRDIWSKDPACAGVESEYFFLQEKGAAEIKAKGAYFDLLHEKVIRTCSSCPVQPACLEYAMDNKYLTGIWGGLTAKERNRARARAASLTQTK